MRVAHTTSRSCAPSLRRSIDHVSVVVEEIAVNESREACGVLDLRDDVRSQVLSKSRTVRRWIECRMAVPDDEQHVLGDLRTYPERSINTSSPLAPRVREHLVDKPEIDVNEAAEDRVRVRRLDVAVVERVLREYEICSQQRGPSGYQSGSCHSSGTRQAT